MPKKTVRRSTSSSTARPTSRRGDSVNFTFFNSKMFLVLVAVALVVMVLAVYSSMTNTTQKPYTTNTMDQYRIDTNTLKTDPDAQNVIPH